jgi:hypothetical protein
MRRGKMKKSRLLCVFFCYIFLFAGSTSAFLIEGSWNSTDSPDLIYTGTWESEIHAASDPSGQWSINGLERTGGTVIDEGTTVYGSYSSAYYQVIDHTNDYGTVSFYFNGDTYNVPGLSGESFSTFYFSSQTAYDQYGIGALVGIEDINFTQSVSVLENDTLFEVELVIEGYRTWEDYSGSTPIHGGPVDYVQLNIEAVPAPVPELIADAGENVAIYSEYIMSTTIYGTATYTGTNSLDYRWLRGDTILLDWTPVGQDNACTYISENTVIPPGTYTLTLKVTDGEFLSSDTMILTIFNSAPHVALLGGAGTYDIGSDVVLSSQASDFDGDLLTFEWQASGVVSSGSIQSLSGGEPVGLPNCILSGLDLGIHVFTLKVSDGINDIVSVDATVEVVDTQVPTLAPIVSAGILWPPNHQMEEITIETNASDNSGLPITISAYVTSNEPEEGLGDGDVFPDWTELEIDEVNGIITLQLRAERSGTGDGREYTINIVATDSSGNSSSVDKIIIVPHDKSKK